MIGARQRAHRLSLSHARTHARHRTPNRSWLALALALAAALVLAAPLVRADGGDADEKESLAEYKALAAEYAAKAQVRVSVRVRGARARARARACV